MSHDFDWAVIGSGFGGSVAALRLAEKGYSVCVLEQGRRWEDRDFAADAGETSKVFWAPQVGMRGIMKLTIFKHVTVISGVGVGGGSLVYANTLYVPRSDDFYRHPGWAEIADWRGELAPHYETASRMLGVVECDSDGPSERLMRSLADGIGAPEGYRQTPVGVFFGEPGHEGETVPDPYFAGEGPDRTACIRCGQCLLGCRYGAKNTLVKNYLWLAERRGVRVEAESEVIDVAPLPGPGEPGAAGYRLALRGPGPLRGRRRELTAKGVIVAGGALGTNKLLRRCRDSGSLGGISERLGRMVRTNSETITAATSERPGADYSADVAITASVFPDDHTHFTNNTYGGAGDRMGLNFGPLTTGGGRLSRVAGVAAAAVGKPGRWLRPARRLDGWSKRTVIFTTMQSTDTALRFRRRRGPLGRSGAVQTELEPGATPPENSIPLANEVAERAAEEIGGYAQSSLMESLLSTPGTAHLLGGAVIGRDPGSGVVDGRQRVFGYENLLICDGSAVPANPGVNPSLTITAMAERALSKIPAAGSMD
ncbi:MAG TPA: GMC family oxidoreductase [Solirubrobacterales bacterium]|nr:GMC family oxidoreductase [Solirubrobacterales bacterium]